MGDAATLSLASFWQCSILVQQDEADEKLSCRLPDICWFPWHLAPEGRAERLGCEQTHAASRATPGDSSERLPKASGRRRRKIMPRSGRTGRYCTKCCAAIWAATEGSSVVVFPSGLLWNVDVRLPEPRAFASCRLPLVVERRRHPAVAHRV